MWSHRASRQQVEGKCGHASRSRRFTLRGVWDGEAYMKSVGIREAKARLSALARGAAEGEVTILTDHGKPIARIVGVEQTTQEESGSDAGDFSKALLSLPYHLDVGF